VLFSSSKSAQSSSGTSIGGFLMPLQAVTAVKGHAVSDDGRHIALAFATKDGGELSIMLAADCLESCISALHRANSVARNKRASKPEQVSVTIPKTWMVTAQRNTVVLVFDAKTEARVGYALDVEASKKLAAALAHNANAIARQTAAKKN
jgi:hypothetical protein